MKHGKRYRHLHKRNALSTDGQKRPEHPIKLPSVLEEALLSGRCILFLGAGFSKPAAAPSWRRLLDDIAHRFSPGNVSRIEKYFSRNDPWGAADLVCGAAPRPELETFVRDRLEHLTPQAAHLTIARNHWAAIFTTNFDTLVEDAYKTETLPAQQPVPVYQFSKDYNIHQNSKVHIFKLHGSIDQIHQRENILVLTTKDQADIQRQRSTMLAQIPRLLIDYYWLFLGYSFNDGILRSLLADVKKNNRDQMPRDSFAVLPDPTQEDRELLEPYRIGLISATTEQFASAIESLVNREAMGQKRVRKLQDQIVTGGVEFTLPAATRVAMDDQFEFVGPAEPEPQARDFFLGGEPSWGNIAAQTDFRREELTNKIKGKVREGLKEAPDRAIVISGPAGSGKTTVLRRVGYELSDGLGESVPVLLLRETFHAGNRFADSWDSRLINEVVRSSGKSVVLLIDNLEVHYRLARNLFSALRSQNIKGLILAAVRSLDWSNLQDDYPMPGFEAIELPDSLADSDVDPFVTYLDRRGLININAIRDTSYWHHQISGTHEHHLLGVMRSLTSVTEQSFDEKIISEYFDLPDLAKRAYELICLAYQFGFPIPLDLLLVLLPCSEPEFAEGVLAEDKDHVIITAAQSLSGRRTYKARHRVIAEIVSNSRWDSTYLLCGALVELISKMNPHSEDEYRLCRELLMSDEIRKRLTDIEYRRRLFNAALEIFPDDNVFYQHYAISEMQARPEPDFQRAHELLNTAAASPTAYRNPTIQHTRGMLYLRQAREASEEGKKKYFEKKAEDEFTAYRKRDRGSEYGYYTHAKMLLEQRSEADESDAARLLSRALQIVREGLNTVEEEDLARLPLLEGEILGEVNPAEALRKLDKWIQYSPSPDAFFVRAVIRMRDNQDAGAKNDIDSGLKLAPDHRALLLLKVELMRKVGGYQSSEMLDAVRNAMLHAPDSPRLAFDAAVLAYHMDRLTDATDAFRRAFASAGGRAGKPRALLFADPIQELGMNRKLRALSEKWGKTLEIPDTVKPRVALVTGVLEGSNEEPTAIRRDGHGDLIFVRPQDRKSWMKPGNPVTFNIAFNYQGPLAINVEKRVRHTSTLQSR
ncbi:MAG TPA: SIR2 family protein [Candidatus Angelobacter sp.]|nr:SIR2 family protein [Candidatus Angelobacter sp.]